MAGLVLRESARSFGLNLDLQAAAGLACYGFLSLMPLLLLLLFLIGLFVRSSVSVLQSVQALASDLFPAFNQAILEDLYAISQKKVWGLISVIMLVWSITPFAAALRAAIRHIFKSERRLPLVLSKLLDLTAVLAVLGLFVFIIVLRVYYGAAHDIPVLGRLVTQAAPFVLTVLIMAFFYAVFAPTRLRPGELLAGALTATVLLSVMRPLFALLLEFNPNYGYAFGSLKAIFILIVWVYYTFAVLLLGAEVMANVRRRETLVLRGLFEPGRSAQPSALLARFARRLAAGERLFDEGDAGHEMFFIVSGAIRLRAGGRDLRTLQAGAYFGEMSMLLGSPRTAAAEAIEETELVAVSESNFELLLRENPRIVKALLTEMAARLKAMNEKNVTRAP